MDLLPLSSEELELSLILAQASHLTYSNKLSVTEIKEKTGISVVKFFDYNATLKWNIVGFWGCYRDYLTIAIRGTNNIGDWRKNFCFWPNHEFCLKDGSGSRVHDGFSRSVEESWKEFLEDLQLLIRENRGENEWKLLLTGHSLGGALAVLTAYRLSSFPEFNSKIQAVYTYGAPRVGDQIFKDSYKITHYRFEYGNDPVPALPPSMSGYRHSGQKFYLPKNEPNVIRKNSQGTQAYSAFANFLGGGVNLFLAYRNVQNGINLQSISDQVQDGISFASEGIEDVGDHDIEKYIQHIKGCNQFTVIVRGLQDGSLKRFGGTIRETKTGRLVGHLFESLGVTDRSRIQPSSPILGGGSFVTGGLGRGIPMQISQIAPGASILNLGVSLAGFAYMSYKLNQIQNALDNVQKSMEAGFDRIEEHLDSLSGQLAYIHLLVEHSRQEQQRLGQAISELHRTVLIQEMASLRAEILDRSRFPDSPIQNMLKVASRSRIVMSDQALRSEPALDAQTMLITDVAIQGWVAAIAAEACLLLDSGQILDAEQVLDSEVSRFQDMAVRWTTLLLADERPQLATAYRFATSRFEEHISLERVERIARISPADRSLSEEQIRRKKNDAEIEFEMFYGSRQYNEEWTRRQIAAAEYLDALSELLARLESVQAFATLCKNQGVKSSRELLPRPNADLGLYIFPVE